MVIDIRNFFKNKIKYICGPIRGVRQLGYATGVCLTRNRSTRDKRVSSGRCCEYSRVGKMAGRLRALPRRSPPPPTSCSSDNTRISVRPCPSTGDAHACYAYAGSTVFPRGHVRDKDRSEKTDVARARSV